MRVKAADLLGMPAIRPYHRGWLRFDVLAGLATGSVVIPQAMAYASVANMPVQFGLYTCMVPLVVYAVIGGSRTASVSTTSTIGTLTASTMLGAGIVAGSPDAPTELITLTLLVGLVLLIARLLRLGSVIENVNQATLIGIKAGVGLTVAASQLPKLLGVQPDPHDEGFFKVLWAALRQLDQANIATMLLSAGAISVLLVMTRWAPSLPAPRVVVAGGIALGAFTRLPELGVSLIPEVPRGIPAPGLPALAHVPELVPGALAIALMAFLETLAVARGVRRLDEPQIDPNRELSATGLAAVFGAFFHSLPPSGGFSQTGMNLKSGARSQVSGLVTAALAVVVAVLLAPVLSELPQAILGALVLVAVIGLVDVKALGALYRFDKHEFALAAAVGILGLTAGLLPAVAAGVVLMLYSVLRELNKAHIAQLTEQDGRWVDGPENRLRASADPLIIRSRVALYTANLRPNADSVRAIVTQCSPRPKTVVWDLSAQPAVSSTILDGLRDAEAELSDLRIVYAALPEDVRRAAQRWPWWQKVEEENRYFATVDDAVSQ